MKNIRLFLILVVLIIIAGIYYFSNNKGTLNLRNASFAIESPDKITKVELKSDNAVLLLKRESDGWKVNNKYKATTSYVENLNLVLSRITVLSPVSKVEKEQVASILQNDGILVGVYRNRKSLKKFYVSKPSMNKEKTYMMMERSTDPFIVRIPAFKGLLAELFITDENYWRNKTVFDYEPQNIESIALVYPENETKSFKAINYNDGTFAIKKMDDNKFLEDYNVDKLARYFTYYQRITFDDIVTNLDQIQTDSILNSSPYCVISVKDESGVENKIIIYRKPSDNEVDEFGNKIKFDYDKAYATLNNNNELIIIEYYIFDPLFKEIDYFR